MKQKIFSLIAILFFLFVFNSCSTSEFYFPNPFESATEPLEPAPSVISKPELPAAAMKSRIPEKIKVSIRLFNPGDKDYGMWNALLAGSRSKPLSWKDATKLPGKTLYFLEGGFSLGGHDYKGTVTLDKNYKGQIRLINELDIEDYLKNVVPSEMPYTWPLEALKAQAVVARTYAIYDYLHSTGFLESSVSDQVYKGGKSNYPSTVQAVEATRGEVLAYGGEVFPTYFHSASGGMTTTVPYVWAKRENIPALESVQDPYSKGSTLQNWQSELSPEALGKLFAAKGHNLGTIRGIQILKRDPSGRAFQIRVTGTRGEKTFYGNDFRLILGWTNLKSTLFEVKSMRGKFVFIGHGFGHGVGFSQWGAKIMAQKGFTYEKILKFYFPKAEIAEKS